MTKNQIAVLILAMCLVFLVNNADARPTNYCTADEKNNYATVSYTHLTLPTNREV